ncbi:MAG: hypothetical protein U0838_15795 [Chloroflexota bacterium]
MDLWAVVDPGRTKPPDMPDPAPAAAAWPRPPPRGAPAELRTARTIAAGQPDRIPVVAYGEGAAARWATAVGPTPILSIAPDGLAPASVPSFPR